MTTNTIPIWEKRNFRTVLKKTPVSFLFLRTSS